MTEVFNNIEQYIELTQEYNATVIAGGAAFWSRPPEEIESRHQQLMIVQFEYTENWDTQEMHPLCDEIITLLEGDAEFILNPGAEETRVKVKAGETLIIPRGTWHTGHVAGRALAQHILMGKGTQVKKLNA